MTKRQNGQRSILGLNLTEMTNPLPGLGRTFFITFQCHMMPFRYSNKGVHRGVLAYAWLRV